MCLSNSKFQISNSDFEISRYLLQSNILLKGLPLPVNFYFGPNAVSGNTYRVKCFMDRIKIKIQLLTKGHRCFFIVSYVFHKKISLVRIGKQTIFNGKPGVKVIDGRC